MKSKLLICLKVMIASSKREGSIRDPKEDEKNLRLFVIVPKSYTKEELRKDFEVCVLSIKKKGYAGFSITFY